MKRLVFLPLMTALVLVFAIAACGASGEDSGLPGRPGFSGPPGAPGAFASNSSEDRVVLEKIVLEKPVSRSARLADADVVERKIVTNVDMNIRVDDVNDAIEEVTKLVDASGGFVVSVSRTEDEDETFASMSFRVPSNNLDATLSRVRDISERVERENRSAQDVTTEFVDIEARLGNLRAAEEQLLVLFERSGKVSDVLEVQRELTNVRGQIESLQGRLNYLSQTTATSLVSVWFHPTTSTAPISDPAWSPSETARGATRGLAAFGRWSADVAITVAIFSPVWVPIIVLVLVLVLWDQRRQRKNAERAKAAAESQPEPAADSDRSIPDQAAQQEKQE